MLKYFRVPLEMKCPLIWVTHQTAREAHFHIMIVDKKKILTNYFCLLWNLPRVTGKVCLRPTSNKKFRNFHHLSVQLLNYGVGHIPLNLNLEHVVAKFNGTKCPILWGREKHRTNLMLIQWDIKIKRVNKWPSPIREAPIEGNLVRVKGLYAFVLFVSTVQVQVSHGGSGPSQLCCIGNFFPPINLVTSLTRNFICPFVLFAATLIASLWSSHYLAGVACGSSASLQLLNLLHNSPNQLTWSGFDFAPIF